MDKQEHPTPEMNWKTLTAHPAADMFPLMTASDVESLANNIRLNGQLFPITLTKDGKQILDGRNRLRAYQQPQLAGAEPWIETYKGSLTPVDYVRSVNWERMHLSQSQRTALAVLLLPDEKRKAAERQLAGKTLESTDAKVETGRAAEVAAKKMNVSKRQVERLAAVQKEAPEAFEKVKEGKSTVRAEHAKLPKKAKAAPKKIAEADQEALGTKDAIKRLEKVQQSSLSLLDVAASVYAATDTDAEYFIDAFTSVQNTLIELSNGIRKALQERKNLELALAREQASAKDDEPTAVPAD